MAEVRLRPSFRGSGQALGVVTLVVCSAFFIVGGLYDPGSAGGILFLTLGIIGVVGFGGVLVVVVGHLLGRRPLLVIDETGVTVPAKWPISRSRDRHLPWADVAAVCAWSEGVPTGRGLSHQLSFLARPEAPEARRSGGAEMIMVKTHGLPGVPLLRWSVRALPGWTVGLDEVIKTVRSHTDAPYEDRRVGLPRKRKVVRKAPPAA
ncbi:hypothetical protein GCM10027589_19300 [Actinocorallia lasiicapitis]